LFGAPDPAGMADLSVGLQFDGFQL
jgi:hypothetical protein